MAELTEEETLERVLRLWRRFGFWIVIFLAMVLSAIFGFTYTAAVHDKTRADAGEIYYALKSAVDEGDLAKAAEYFAELSDDDFPAVRRLAAFSLATGHYKEKQYESAIDLLQDALLKEDDPGLRDLAVLRLSELYINAERYEDALQVLEANLPLREGQMSILMHERIGDVYFTNNNQRKALLQYRKAALLAARLSPSYRVPIRIKISALLSLRSWDVNDDEDDEGDKEDKDDNAEGLGVQAADDSSSFAEESPTE